MNRISPNARRACVATLATLAGALGGSALAQGPLEGRPYGAPSECQPGGPAALGLYLATTDGTGAALRLEGGTPGAPAAIVIAAEQAETPLTGGGTLLVGPVLRVAAGAFDAYGVFAPALDEACFAAGDVVYAQGVQPTWGGAGGELSGGLRIAVRENDAPGSTPPAGTPPIPEEILVEELGAMLHDGHLEAALALALNSKDDAIALELKGELQVPVWAGITAGGKAAVKAGVKRGEDGSTVVYEIAIGADVAGAAGVGAGVAGVGVSSGYGGDVIWRYDSTHEVARAVRSMVILQAVGPRLEAACLAIDARIDRLDRALETARRVADRARGLVRAFAPWRHNALAQRLQQRLDELRAQRRAMVDAARAAVEQLVSWVATERIFLTEHLHGFEVRKTTALEASLSTPGFGDAEKGGEWGFANLGASLNGGIERQFSIRVERGADGTVLGGELKAAFTKSVAAAAGFVVGGSAAGKRVLEISQKVAVGADGALLRQPATVKLTLDGKLLGALGAVVVGQYGVGGEVSLEVALADLVGLHADAVMILLGDDTTSAGELIRALPIALQARGRYEAGITAGIGLEIKGAFKGGIGASATMTDWAAGVAYDGTVGGLPLAEVLRAGPLPCQDAGITTKLAAVGDEVARVMQR